MKNYVQLNQAVKLKQNQSKISAVSKINGTLTPKGTTLSSKVSLKTIGSETNTLKQSKKSSILAMTRSAKQISQPYLIENEELNQMNMLGLHEGE